MLSTKCTQILVPRCRKDIKQSSLIFHIRLYNLFIRVTRVLTTGSYRLKFRMKAIFFGWDFLSIQISYVIWECVDATLTLILHSRHISPTGGTAVVYAVYAKNE